LQLVIQGTGCGSLWILAVWTGGIGVICRQNTTGWFTFASVKFNAIEGKLEGGIVFEAVTQNNSDLQTLAAVEQTIVTFVVNLPLSAIT
jgi:hypothetical protein